MKIKLHYLLIGLVLLFVSACSDSDDPIPGPSDKGGECTVLALWIGENDLSEFAISDFNEMVEGVANVDVTKNNFVVYCDTQNDAPHLIHISKQSGRIVADTIHTYKEQNSLKKEVMSSVISKVIAEFPAKSYGLILASHADGWIEASISADTRHFGDYNGTKMNIQALREVLEGFPRFDFILFDACYMQSVEVAYELRNITDYVISSPTEIPGPGAPYQKVVPLVFSTSDVAKNIAQGYYEYYGNADGSIKTNAEYILGGSARRWPYGVSVSVLKTSELENLAAVTENILSRYIGNKEVVKTSSLFYYGYAIGNGGNTYYYDLDRLIAQVTGENEEYRAWREVFDKAQPYFATTETCFANRMSPKEFSMERAGGVSTYVPKNELKVHQFYRTLQWYTDGAVWYSSGW